MSEVKVWKEGSSGEPTFPDSFEVVKKAVLQVTDIKTNRNKYYAIELHSSKNKYRVYTHYGRTDDLDSNPNAGIRESRYCDSLLDAENIYDKIYKEKTSARKGYKELSLASSKIGSKKSLGKSSGEIDDKTLEKLADNKSSTPVIHLNKSVQNLVAHLYSEATNALVSTVNATITAKGIETPLGVLTIGQIDKGESILDSLSEVLSKKKKDQDKIVQLSGNFYTLIPHKFGRSRTAVEAAVIDNINKISEKQETLHLMRDMLNVNSKSNVLNDNGIDKKYNALGCEINAVSKDKETELKKFISKSVVSKYDKFKIKNIFEIKRAQEQLDYNTSIGNDQLLFHGSAAKNWVGILSRGLLLPKSVVKLGVSRTDAGWLGHGIYFGNAACTAYNYAHSSKFNSRFITIACVALGKIKDYRKITYNLTSPPNGYNSCHGVRADNSEFDDDEFVVYSQNQQKLEYLVELE